MTHPCTQYALDVVEGRRVVGQSERLACQRHLDDLARQGSESFPWIFDEAKADKIYDWFHYCHHVKGPLAGQPIDLLPFQKFDLGCVFGWVHKDTGFRRFEKSYNQRARKNAKSTEMSGIALYLMAGDKEESPEVYCAAVDREQARIVWKDARIMGQKSPDIRKRLKILNYSITHITRGGELKALSKETKNKDGLNPSGVIIDEYHAHPTSEIYDLLWSAWGQRSQALMAIITTAGFETVENPCHDEYEYCKKILAKIVNNERYFVMIRELDPKDNEHDPANWIKANPLRAATPEGLAKLKEQHDEAFGSGIPEKIRNFRVKNLDIWVNETENSYIGEYITRWDGLAVSREKFIELDSRAVLHRRRRPLQEDRPDRSSVLVLSSGWAHCDFRPGLHTRCRHGQTREERRRPLSGVGAGWVDHGYTGGRDRLPRSADVHPGPRAGLRMEGARIHLRSLQRHPVRQRTPRRGLHLRGSTAGGTDPERTHQVVSGAGGQRNAGARRVAGIEMVPGQRGGGAGQQRKHQAEQEECLRQEAHRPAGGSDQRNGTRPGPERHQPGHQRRHQG